jgi:hypothetical protein
MRWRQWEHLSRWAEFSNVGGVGRLHGLQVAAGLVCSVKMLKTWLFAAASMLSNTAGTTFVTIVTPSISVMCSHTPCTFGCLINVFITLLFAGWCAAW